jgi:two-component system, chemotaxis family, response regulator Rcp1
MERMNAPETLIEVLLVEDSPGDVRLTREAFRDAKMHIHLSVVSDGAEAVSHLHRRGGYVNAPRPDLILLDLNLPKKDGREVLAEIKGSQELKSIPVFILTTSSNEDDVLQSYHLHANCYITKPVDLDGFLRVVRSIDSFWLTVVKLPPQEVRTQQTVMAGGTAHLEGIP